MTPTFTLLDGHYAIVRLPADDWRCLKLAGPFPLDQTGVAAAFTRVLADAGIALFVISTYDTDYVLVRDAALEHASAALRASGYTVR